MFESFFEPLVHTIFTLSIFGIIVGLVLGFIPGINRYKLPVMVVSIVLFCGGLWFEGRIAKDKEWKAKIAELEVKLAQAQAEGQKVTKEIVERTVVKQNTIREKGDEVVKYIKVSEQVLVKATCGNNLPEPVVKIHNAAATNNPELLNDAKKEQSAQQKVEQDAKVDKPKDTPVDGTKKAEEQKPLEPPKQVEVQQDAVNTDAVNKAANPKLKLAPKK